MVYIWWDYLVSNDRDIMGYLSYAVLLTAIFVIITANLAFLGIDF
jgi:hypothetical protein